MRLNAYLARAGIASRRRAEELIRAGRVTVNGQGAGLATTVSEGDLVALDGLALAPEPLVYVLLNKPPGVVTTARDPQGRPTVVGVVAHRQRIVPVGRLDIDTTGALVLTNDGDLANRLSHPRYGVEKVYEVEVDEVPDAADLRRLREGIELEDGVTAPAGARLLPSGVLELALHEGRKRQVKRMCAAIGHPAKRLHRRRYAGLDVDDLRVGAWRELSPTEVERLRRPPRSIIR